MGDVNFHVREQEPDKHMTNPKDTVYLEVFTPLLEEPQRCAIFTLNALDLCRWKGLSASFGQLKDRALQEKAPANEGQHKVPCNIKKGGKLPFAIILQVTIPGNRASSRAEAQPVIFFLWASAIGGERWCHNALPVDEDDVF